MKRLVLALLFIPSLVFGADTAPPWAVANNAYDAWVLVQKMELERVKVAVIDMGFVTSNELSQNVIAHRNFWGSGSYRRTPPNDPVSGDDAMVYPYTGLTAHGTWVASIAGAPHDGTGMAGGAPNADLMLLRGFYNVGNHGDYWPLHYAIKWAVDNGAKVINISTGDRQAATNNVPNSSTYRTYLARYQSAIDYAYNNGVLVTTGVGNSYDNLDDNATFWEPAEMSNLPIVVGGLHDNGVYPATGGLCPSEAPNWNNSWCEGASDETETGYRGTNYGSVVNLAIPSRNTCGIWGEAGYQCNNMSGLSGAAAQLAGLAALMWGVNPNLTRDEVVSIILNNTDTIGTPYVDVGTNKINYYKAVQAAIAMDTHVLENVTDSGFSVDTNVSAPPLSPVLDPDPIMVESSLHLYSTTQNAYDSVAEQVDTIKAKAGEIGYENLIFDRNIKVRLKGGHDSLFGKIVADTKITGSLVVSDGQVIVTDFVIK